MTDYARDLLVHFYRMGRPLFIDEGKYAVEGLLLESHGWVRCVRLEADQTGARKPAYRVQFTNLGEREALARISEVGG